MASRPCTLSLVAFAASCQEDEGSRERLDWTDWSADSKHRALGLVPLGQLLGLQSPQGQA